MRFEYEGKRYGLAVALCDGRFEQSSEIQSDGSQLVILSDDRLKLLIQMLEDLRWSRSETIRELAHGCYEENKAVACPSRPARFI